MLPVYISSICNLIHVWFGFLFSVYGISRVIKKTRFVTLKIKLACLSIDQRLSIISAERNKPYTLLTKEKNMTDHERYLFDLQGFLVIPNALRSETVSLLNQLMDAKISESCVQNMKTHRFVGLLDWGYAYRELIDNPKVYDYLEELLGTNFRFNHDYADIILG